MNQERRTSDLCVPPCSVVVLPRTASGVAGKAWRLGEQLRCETGRAAPPRDHRLKVSSPRTASGVADYVTLTSEFEAESRPKGDRQPKAARRVSEANQRDGDGGG